MATAIKIRLVIFGRLKARKHRKRKARRVDAIVRTGARPDALKCFGFKIPQAAPTVRTEIMPFVDDQFAVLEAVRVAQFAHGLGVGNDFFDTMTVIMPGHEVRRDSGLLACRENALEPLKAASACGAHRRTAELAFGKFALEALEARNEELAEKIATHLVALGEFRRAPHAIAFGQAPHVVYAVRLVPKLPVLDIPIVAVTPPLGIMADRSCEDLGGLIKVLRDERIEMNSSKDLNVS